MSSVTSSPGTDFVSSHLTLIDATSLNGYSLAMSQDQLIMLKHAATGEVYWTRKNKKLVTRKIELKKYSKKLRKHVVFKETKK